MKQSMYSKYYKRVFDFLFSAILLLLLSPLLIIIALLIKIESKGPVFFKQKRPGKNKEVFEVYKFRTMKKDAVIHQKIGIEIVGNDSRITPLGKILRRFKIDELAQLINIVKGDMSVVGPRPTLPEYIEYYEEWELERFKVKPGLTGLAQTRGNIYLDRKQRSLYDVKYADNVKFLIDIRIIFKTFAIVLFGEGKFVKKTDIESGEESSDK